MQDQNFIKRNKETSNINSCYKKMSKLYKVSFKNIIPTHVIDQVNKNCNTIKGRVKEGRTTGESTTN